MVVRFSCGEIFVPRKPDAEGARASGVPHRSPPGALTAFLCT